MNMYNYIYTVHTHTHVQLQMYIIINVHVHIHAYLCILYMYIIRIITTYTSQGYPPSYHYIWIYYDKCVLHLTADTINDDCMYSIY